MKVSLRNVTDVLGPLPQMTRLSSPVAHVVGAVLESSMPELTPAAARVIAQHMWYHVQHGPAIGAADAILKLAERFGLTPRKIHAAPALMDIVRNNEPLSVFIAIARKVSAAKRREEKRGGAPSAGGYTPQQAECIRMMMTHQGGAPSAGAMTDAEEIRHLQDMIAKAAVEESLAGAGISDIIASALRAASSGTSRVADIARSAAELAKSAASSELAQSIGRDVVLATAQRTLGLEPPKDEKKYVKDDERRARARVREAERELAEAEEDEPRARTYARDDLRRGRARAAEALVEEREARRDAAKAPKPKPRPVPRKTLYTAFRDDRGGAPARAVPNPRKRVPVREPEVAPRASDAPARRVMREERQAIAAPVADEAVLRAVMEPRWEQERRRQLQLGPDYRAHAAIPMDEVRRIYAEMRAGV